MVFGFMEKYTSFACNCNCICGFEGNIWQKLHPYYWPLHAMTFFKWTIYVHMYANGYLVFTWPFVCLPEDWNSQTIECCKVNAFALILLFAFFLSLSISLTLKLTCMYAVPRIEHVSKCNSLANECNILFFYVHSDRYDLYRDFLLQCRAFSLPILFCFVDKN